MAECRRPPQQSRFHLLRLRRRNQPPVAVDHPIAAPHEAWLFHAPQALAALQTVQQGLATSSPPDWETQRSRRERQSRLLVPERSSVPFPCAGEIPSPRK